ncbi:MAG: EF-P beta-lysylation protein EpmB [Legionellales bacterium]|nr:EF-P beta-lysylation protein EpmB [Legionellales bacterium]
MTSLQNWQELLKQGINNTADLLSHLQLDPVDVPEALLPTQPFKMRVPLGFVARMQIGNPHDPLLRQVLPIADEHKLSSDFTRDPLNENISNPVPGLLQKYKTRVLLTISGACAINCRYCFRRHFPYSDNNPGMNGWMAAIDYIRARPDISEVIFSGGDPLTAPDNFLATLANHLASIPHVTTLRIHTRMPIVLPERINNEFIDWFTGSRLKPVLVTHCNHPQEIDTSVAYAARCLQQAGVLLLNQSVLLKGINDNVSILTTLSNKLFECHILPYYLNLLDKVEGTAHFDLPQTTAIALHQELLAHLPGYLVPRLIREIPGKPSKTLIR